MKKTSGILVCLLFFLTYADAQKINRYLFADVLNVQMEVKDTNDVEESFFSDMGAWHAYALPQNKEDYGSFIGPLLMDISGKWLSNSFTQLHGFENGKEINLSSAKASLHYYPGLLQQEYEISELKILLQLIFVSNREALIQIKVNNLSNGKRNLSLEWSGKSLLNTTNISESHNGVDVNFSDNEHKFYITYFTKAIVKVNAKGNHYSATIQDIVLQPKQNFQFTQMQQFYLHSGEAHKTRLRYNFSVELKKNERRWNGYLQKYFSNPTVLNDQKKWLAVKCIETLLTNWRSSAKDLLHDGVYPSASFQGFYGCWSWDSWKQAVALSLFHSKLAKENILTMFDYQQPDGMIPDVIFVNTRDRPSSADRQFDQLN